MQEKPDSEKQGKTVVIGIDPGKTTGWACLIFDGERLPQIETVEVKPNMDNIPFDIEPLDYDFEQRTVREAWHSIVTTATQLDNFEDYRILVGIEGVAYYASSTIMGRDLIHTAYDVGCFIIYAQSLAIQPKVFTHPQHIRYTVGPGATKRGTQVEKNRRLRLALENLYGVEKIKAAKCTNDHKRNALSVATAYAMELNLISW